MNQTHLKKIRVIISLFFFLLTAFLFLDFTQLFPATITQSILYLQFVPSLVQFINVFSLAATGFIIVLILTLLFGRVFCSTICPLGTLQDIFIYLSGKLRKNKKKVRFRFTKPHNILRYTLLILTVITFLSGSLILLNLLDPFSNFGRIFSSLIRPIYIGFNNLVTYCLEFFELYILYPVDLKTVNLLTWLVPLLVLSLLIGLSITHGRLYCNTICPVGTLLGFLSQWAWFKIQINQTLCTTCAKCSIECKASCIHLKTKTVDFSRCVGCFNCIIVCPGLGIDYKNTWSKVAKSPRIISIDISKRAFLSHTLFYTTGITALSASAEKLPTNSQPTTLINDKKYPVSPPGSKSLEHFTHYCIACQLCVSHCPTHVLQPAFLQYGLVGLLQPTMDYHVSFCHYECTICGEICPTGAIWPLTIEEKKTAQIGLVKFLKENCVVYTDKTDCGACDEHCPTEAVHLVPYETDLMIPEINEKQCIGCGACEYICPTRPHRAIYVDGQPKHLIAEKPQVKEAIQVDIEADFPF